MSEIQINGLFTYPIKSCAGHSVSALALDEGGVHGDRQWVWVDGDGTFLSQRRSPRMALIRPRQDDDGLWLEMAGQDSLWVPDRRQTRVSVSMWGDEHCDGFDQGEVASEWFERLIGVPGRLVRFDMGHHREIDEKYGSGRFTGFADGFPLLIVSQAALMSVAQELDITSTQAALRFRPNIVLSGCKAFEEDCWQGLTIGSVAIDLVKACARCSVVNVDPETGSPGREPLRSLARSRLVDGEVRFGQNGVHRSHGTIRVGDSVSPS